MFFFIEMREGEVGEDVGKVRKRKCEFLTITNNTRDEHEVIIMCRMTTRDWVSVAQHFYFSLILDSRIPH